MKFDELIKKKKIDINELIELKNFIFEIYEIENNPEYKSIKKSLHLIDFKI
jgi:hypothetical protein